MNSELTPSLDQSQDKTLSIYNFLKELNNFKLQDRLSLIEEGGRRESDAEHTWHLVMAVWLYSSYLEKDINLLKAIKMALVHDLVEIYAGDVYGGATDEERVGKEEKERLSAEKLFSQLPPELYREFTDLWNEYEQRDSTESQFVWALDKIAPRFQLTITKTDVATNIPTDKEKLNKQEDKITQFSPMLGDVLKRIQKERENQ